MQFGEKTSGRDERTQEVWTSETATNEASASDCADPTGAASADGRKPAVREGKTSTGLLIFILAVGVFGILNTEMGVVGILPQVSERFGVSVPDAGLLVSLFALVVAVAGPTMPLLFSKFNRKAVMLLSLGVFSVCNVVSVFAPSFEVLLAARVAPAAFHPLYVSMALAVAAQTGRTEAESAKASSRVFVGVSAGMVLGVPVASFLASVVDLRASLAFFAVVTILVFVATLFFVPSMPVSDRMTYGKQLAILRKPILWASLLAVAAINGGMFGFYSFLADFLGSVSGMGAAGVSAVLLIYGAANIVGNVASGHLLAANANRTVLTMPLILIGCYTVLFLLGQLGVATAVVVLILGVFAGIANNANQFLVARAAPEALDFGNGLYLTAANLGTTVGTAVCGTFITAGGTQWAVAGAVIFLAAGVVFVVWRQRCANGKLRLQAIAAACCLTVAFVALAGCATPTGGAADETGAAAEQVESSAAGASESTEDEPVESTVETEATAEAGASVESEAGAADEADETEADAAEATLRIGGQNFVVTLADNETARAFAARLPMTVEMAELNDNEKYAYLDESLPTNASSPGSVAAGDVMLFGSDCLVVFYEGFSTSYSYTRIGQIDDATGLVAAVGAGSVTAEWSAA